MLSKNIIRREMLTKRLSLSDEQRRAGENHLLRNLSNFLQDKIDVSLFVAIRGEPNILSLLPNPLLPCIEKDILVFKRFSGCLIPGKYKTWEPPLHASIVVPKTVCVPLLAFRRNGDRLGYGGGYYDRFFMNFCGKKIGVAWSIQEVQELFAEPHDVPLDWVITEKEIIDCRKESDQGL